MASKDNAKLLSLIFAIGRRLRSVSQRNDGRLPFSMLHFHTLHYVANEKRPSMHDVARYLGITPPAATLLIDGLVKEGLLKRSLDRKDRRTVRLGLTAKGKAFMVRAARKRKATFETLFSILTAKERAELARILQKVAKGPQ